jgi:predicted DNA-binding transcriptional regulator YafY
MRADRLISIVMLLQSHEKMTADKLSQELEVSTRTIYRDITALNIAGIPIYTDRGPGGGISLVDSYRTTLTGMSEAEARALFTLSIPNSLVELGIGSTLKSALLKLSAALPPGQQATQIHTQQRVYLDSTSWNEPTKPSAHLGMIHQAVWEDRQVRLTYRGSFDTQLEFIIEPLGLVAKMNVWHLVARDKGHVRVFKVANILDVKILYQKFFRPSDFDLAKFWKGWCTSTQNQRATYCARLRMAPTLLKKLHYYIGEAVKFTVLDSAPADDRGWSEVNIQYENFFEARESILNFGRAAEVLEPVALRFSVIDFAAQIVDFYRAKTDKENQRT